MAEISEAFRMAAIDAMDPNLDEEARVTALKEAINACIDDREGGVYDEGEPESEGKPKKGGGMLEIILGGGKKPK